MQRIALVLILLAAPVLAVAGPPAKGAAVAAEPGVQWQQTVEMQMQGFAMPAQTSTVCVPKSGMTEPPGTGRDEKCKVTNVRNDGKRMTWSMTCDGEERMTGEGEILQRPDGYDGKMTVRSSQGEMLMKMSGKKLGTACDAAGMKRQVAALQAEGAALQAQGCKDMASGMVLSMFTGPSAMCKDPADRAAVCRQAATPAGITALSAQPASATDGLPSLCGKDLAALRAEACADAARREAERRCSDGSDGLLAFLGQQCPTETRTVAQRECAGRTYTGLTACYRSFCTTYAGDLLDKGKKTPPPTPKPEDAAGDAAKKAVKSLLPW